MENNLIEMLVKMMSNSNNASMQQNPAYSYYPSQAYQNQMQNNQNGQNNILPMLLSLLGNKSSLADTLSLNKDENKKTEINSVSSDEILL